MNTARRQSGFTLIEIMIVIAIIGILSVIAIPAMKDYAIRARVTELLSVASTPKIAVAEYHITHNAWPSTSAECGLSPIQSTYVTSVDVGKEGVITIVGDDTALGTHGPLIITLTPSYSDGTIKWACRAHGQTQYAPALCRK